MIYRNGEQLIGECQFMSTSDLLEWECLCYAILLGNPNICVIDHYGKIGSNLPDDPGADNITWGY
jgi:hypothetical protein